MLDSFQYLFQYPLNSRVQKPYEGQVWTFTARNTGSNFLGHAWVEYYVPNIGWIACDPTWQSGGYDYFNWIDYLRFNLNIGQWFDIPMLPDESEFPNPCIVFNNPNFDFIFRFKVTATDALLSPLDQFPVFIAIIVVVAINISKDRTKFFREMIPFIEDVHMLLS